MTELDRLSLLIISLITATVRWAGIVITLWLAMSHLDPWVLALIEGMSR